MFGRLKDWRRTAIRYDRCAYTFMSAICIAATLIFWLSAHTLMPGMRLDGCSGVRYLFDLVGSCMILESVNDTQIEV